MNTADVYAAVRKHLHAFFTGHQHEEQIWTVGPTWKVPSTFRVVEFTPGPKSDFWIYASIGAWEGQSESRLEFFIIAPAQDVRHVELLTMTAWYHRSQRLGLGHTFPIGEPWLPGSSCNVMLVSHPYTFGPELETCCLTPDDHLHFFWLLPITAKERQFKVREGLEALEQRFEECALEYWLPERDSVV
jgi:hypothetical protein